MRRPCGGYLFISHDIVVVAGLCQILVLERGRIVEEAIAGELLTAPQQPHTQTLVADTPMRGGAEGSFLEPAS